MSRLSCPLTLIWRLWSNFQPACIATASDSDVNQSGPSRVAAPFTRVSKQAPHEPSFPFLTTSIECYLVGSLGTQPTTNPSGGKVTQTPKQRRKNYTSYRKVPSTRYRGSVVTFMLLEFLRSRTTEVIKITVQPGTGVQGASRRTL